MPQLTTLIPSFAAPVTDRVWLVGAHGGAGCGASILLGAAITDPVPRMPRPLVAARIQLSSAVRVWRLPHIKGLELDGFPRRYPAAYSRLVKDVDAMPRATAHVG